VLPKRELSMVGEALVDAHYVEEEREDSTAAG
jgi:hypothetical protein